MQCLNYIYNSEIMRKVLIPLGIVMLLSSRYAFAQPTAVNDTLVVTTACVVFYQCTKAEYGSFFEQMPFVLNSLVHSFELSRERLIPFLKNLALDMSLRVHHSCFSVEMIL